MKFTRCSALSAALAMAASRAFAGSFPSKPIHFLVPYPVGGIVDIVARAWRRTCRASPTIR